MELAFYLEKSRSHGYTLQHSLAELADNSITHDAKNVWVYMYWSDDQGKNSFVMTMDDGNGMSEDELMNKALAIPKKEHVDQGDKDLSVFGLGLKTGSFNHCRSITVMTKKNKLIKKTLNLNKGITDEMPSCIDHKFAEKILKNFEKQKNGTIILWTDLDKISRLRAIERGPNFYDDCDKSRKHFKLIYHKYLLNNQINLYFNGTDDVNKTKIFDPFYKNNQKTIKLPDTEISFLKGGNTVLKPYIVPNDTGNENLNLSKNELQGIYFFRKNRVIDFGGWFELGEIHAGRYWSLNDRFNRLRIEAEIPAETSKDWITYSKNKVNIPDYAVNKFRKNLVKIRKDYLDKINLMGDDESDKEPMSETLKKKNKLIKMLRNKTLNDEDLLKIESLIKVLK